MIVNIDWEEFHLKFFNAGIVFVKEHPDSFEFYTAEGIFKVHCIWKKNENDEENIAFIERYLTDKKNLIKVLEFEGYEDEEEKEEEEVEFVEKIEDGQ